MPSVEDLKRQLAEAEQAERQTVTPTLPNHQQDAGNPYAATTWGSPYFDFKTPSGQLCQLKKLDVAELAEAGILDKVTRLPGLAGQVVAKSDGAPPTSTPDLPELDVIKAVIEVVNVLVPLVVVQPEILPLPRLDEERQAGRVYVDSIEIADRIAIMNRVLGGLQKLDAFRDGS